MNRAASAALAGWSWTPSGWMKTRLSVAAPQPPFALVWIATAIVPFLAVELGTMMMVRQIFQAKMCVRSC